VVSRNGLKAAVSLGSSECLSQNWSSCATISTGCCTKSGRSARSCRPWSIVEVAEGPAERLNRVSVRAVVLAAARFGPASQTTAKKLEREWAKYRVQNGLDLYGHVATSLTGRRVGANKSACSHTIEGELKIAGTARFHFYVYAVLRPLDRSLSFPEVTSGTFAMEFNEPRSVYRCHNRKAI
jgi:hypothetical protein